VLRLGRSEGTKVVLAAEESCGRVEPVDVERARPPQRAARLERRPPADEDAVAIRACTRGEPGVEVCGRFSGLEHGDVLRQHGVERGSRTLYRRAALDLDARYLPGRMDAGIGAPCHREPVPARKHRTERLEQHTLDRAEPGLARPAVEA